MVHTLLTPRGPRWRGAGGRARAGSPSSPTAHLALLGGRGRGHVGLLGVGLGVLQLGQDLARVAAGVEVVGVLARLLLGTSLAGVARVDQLVLVEVVVLVLVEVGLGHVGEVLVDCGRHWVRENAAAR